jgi:hypothetical protein
MYRTVYIYRLDDLANPDFIGDNMILVMRDRFHVSSSRQCDEYCRRLEKYLNSLSVYKYKVTQYPRDKFHESISEQMLLPSD